ncbi:MAG: proteasome accessory factor PafA2 family protein [Candidatus Riflebacteria bacterium]|nr:proteasome accessory factor PafA2 family protein [Candidatus Riflebacteria bacterium]
MSEYATWLKLATTHLVVRMLEAGYLPAGCRLDDPLSALDQVDQDLTFQERLAIRGAPARTALEIQAAFLDTARRYACDREPDDPQVERTLGEWAQVLDLLAHDRTALADRLDWVAKHDLMDEAVEPVGWDAVSRALGPIRWLEEHNIGLGRVVDQPDQVGGFLQKRLGADFAALAERMRVADLAWDSLPAVYRMFYQLKKIDLRYHEIGEEGGYYLQMEREGLFRRELSAREIERAAEHPPEQTRAAARGHYILEANRLKLPALVGWDELIVPSRFAIISMPDPLCPTPPVALAGFESESFVRTALRLVWFIPRLVSRGA